MPTVLFNTSAGMILEPCPRTGMASGFPPQFAIHAPPLLAPAEAFASCSEAEVDQLAEQLYYDSKRVMQQAAMYLVRQQEEEEEEGRRPREQPPRPMELSLVLCDDAIIQDLNAEWRGVNEPTDVLSFEMGRDEDELTEMKEVEGSDLPVTVMGDIVLSLDTAARQAAERQHSLLDECRVLLVHGVLHLLGYDHEDSES